MLYDPWADREDAQAINAIRPAGRLAPGRYDAVVAHREFITLDPADLRACCREQAVIYDVKHALQEGMVDASL